MALDGGAIQNDFALHGGAVQAAEVTPPIIKLTQGTWSSVVTFEAGDTFHIEIDGPSADDVKISLALKGIGD